MTEQKDFSDLVSILAQKIFEKIYPHSVVFNEKHDVHHVIENAVDSAWIFESQKDDMIDGRIKEIEEGVPDLPITEEERERIKEISRKIYVDLIASKFQGLIGDDQYDIAENVVEESCFFVLTNKDVLYKLQQLNVREKDEVEKEIKRNQKYGKLKLIKK